MVAAALIAPSLAALPARAESGAIDQTGDRAAQTWTDEVLGAVEPNAVLVSWWSYSTPLWYATIVDARRPDICIIDDRNRLDYNLGDLDQVIDRYIATRPVYLIRNGTSELGALAGRYTLAPLGPPATTNVLAVAVTAEHGGPVRAAGRVERAVPVTARLPTLSYFFPAHNEEANLDGLVDGGPRGPADAGRDVRDHHRQRRIAGRDGPARRRADGRPSGRRPGRPPPGQPRLRGGAPVRVPGRAATTTSPSPTAIASSGWPTSAG